MKIVLEKKEYVPRAPGGTVKYGGRKVSGAKKKKPPQYYMKLKAARETAGEAGEPEEEETVTVPIKDNVQHCIINFYTVFSALANFVVCKNCRSKITFKIIEPEGLGFKIELDCKCTPTTKILSSAYDNKTYDINRRFLFVMKLLGIGLAGCQKFCALMDMLPLFEDSTYTAIMNCVTDAVKGITEKCLKKAKKAFEFVADVAACQLKEGNKIYVVMLRAIGVDVGVNAADYVEMADEGRAKKGSKRRQSKRHKGEENQTAEAQGDSTDEDESSDEEMPDED